MTANSCMSHEEQFDFVNHKGGRGTCAWINFLSVDHPMGHIADISKAIFHEHMIICPRNIYFSNSLKTFTFVLGGSQLWIIAVKINVCAYFQVKHTYIRNSVFDFLTFRPRNQITKTQTRH